MPYSGSGGIWKQKGGEFVLSNEAGDATGLANAYAHAAAGGMVHVGPGLEALSLAGLPALASLVRVTNTGVFGIARFYILDPTDPTKMVTFDASAVATATARTITLPNWSGLLPLPSGAGNSGEFLRSGGAGVQPTWAAVAVTHYGLSDTKPFSATSISMGAGSTTLTTTGGQFANVKIGYRVNLDAANYDRSLYGFRVSGLIDSNNVTMDKTNTGLAISGATATVYPMDHWDETLQTGVLPLGGWGTYNAGTGGTRPVMRGGISFEGYQDNGSVTEWDFYGSTSTTTLDGFALKKHSAAKEKVYFYTGALTGNRYVSIVNQSGAMLLDSATQNVSGKNFQAGNVIECQNVVAAGSGTVFSDDADNTKQLLFDCSGITTGSGNGKIAKWQDLSAGGHVDFTYLARVTGIDGTAVATTNLYTVPAGKSVIVTRVVVRCTAATTPAAGPTFGVGVAAGEDDIVASAAHAAFINANTYVLVLPKDPAVVATAAQVIKLGIDVGSTNAAMTLAVDIAGYLV